MGNRAWRVVCILIFLMPIVLATGHTTLNLLFDIVCLLAGLLTVHSSQNLKSSSSFVALTIPFLFLSTFVAFQTFPMPPHALNIISPEVWLDYRESVWHMSPGTWMPISVNVEATIYACFHLTALWALCLAFSQHLSDHWQLLRFYRFFVYAVLSWSTLAISGVYIMDTKIGAIHIAGDLLLTVEKIIVNLTIWSVVCLPLVFASYSVFRAQHQQKISVDQIKLFLRQPSAVPHYSIALSLFITLLNMAFLLSPLVSLACITAYLFYRALQALYLVNKQYLHWLFWLGLSCFSAFLILTWGFYTTSSLWGPSLQVDKGVKYLWEFSWVGRGLGVDDVLTQFAPEINSGPVVQKQSAFATVLHGLGVMGSFLLLLMMLLSFYCLGGKEKLNFRDRINRRLYAGGMASFPIILIFSSLAPVWGWHATLVCSMCMIILTANCCRLSWFPKKKDQLSTRDNMGQLTSGMLSFTLSIFILVGICLFLLKSGSEFVSGSWRWQDFGRNFDIEKERRVEEWAKILTYIAPYDGGAALSLGYRYLLQGRDQEARAILYRALRINPLAPEVHIAIGSLSSCLGEYDNATHFFSSASAQRLKPDIKTERLLTRLIGLEDISPAIQLVNLILMNAPHQTRRILKHMTLHGVEVESLQRLLPRHPIILFELGNISASEGALGLAEELYWSAVFDQKKQSVHDENMYYKIATFFVEQNRFSDAFLVLNSGQKEMPNSQKLKDYESFIRLLANQKVTKKNS